MRTCDVSNVLNNRRKLVRKDLLKKRWELSTSGFNKINIKIKKNSLYTNNKKHGTIVAGVYSEYERVSPPPPDSPSPPDPLFLRSVLVIDCHKQLSLDVLVAKLNTFQSYIETKSFDLVCITETWLYQMIKDAQILSPNYTSTEGIVSPVVVGFTYLHKKFLHFRLHLWKWSQLRFLPNQYFISAVYIFVRNLINNN